MNDEFLCIKTSDILFCSSRRYRFWCGKPVGDNLPHDLYGLMTSRRTGVHCTPTPPVFVC